LTTTIGRNSVKGRARAQKPHFTTWKTDLPFGVTIPEASAGDIVSGNGANDLYLTTGPLTSGASVTIIVIRLFTSVSLPGSSTSRTSVVVVVVVFAAVVAGDEDAEEEEEEEVEDDEAAKAHSLLQYV
jgi:hypothetical protein